MTPEAASDAVLASRAAKGDDRAFAVLVQRHKEPLYRLLRRYTGDSDEAYEAAHEAFISAWGALDRYDPARSFGSWLRTIAINKARDRSRRMSFRHFFFGFKPLDENVEAMDRSDPAAQADDRLVEQEDLATLDRAIASLATPLKEALLLTAFEGLSQSEAAAVLGVSFRTVEGRLRRARQILAAKLGPRLRPVRPKQPS